jgi:hypothetical protein
VADADLRNLLSMLEPTARDVLRRVLIRDEADRDEVAPRLLHYGDRNTGAPSLRWSLAQRSCNLQQLLDGFVLCEVRRY